MMMFRRRRRDRATPPSAITYVCPPVAMAAPAERDGPEPRWAVTRVGTWTGVRGGTVDLSADVLQEAADSYDPSYLRAAINYDHDWGGDALGWIDRLEFDGDVLWAYPVGLVDEAAQRIRDRRRTRVSAEFSRDYELGDGSRSWYFTGLALLGVAEPAVPGLPEITLADNRHVVIRLSDPRDRQTMTPGDEPSEPAPSDTTTDDPPDGEEEDQHMKKPTAGQPGTQPGGTHQPTGQAEQDQNTDQGVQLAAERQARDAELAAVRSEREALAAERQAARIERAESRVDRDLEQLADRVPPCMLRGTGLRELMVSLAAQAPDDQTTIHLAAPTDADPRATEERRAYDVLLRALAALPTSLVALSAELAGDVADGGAPAARDRRTADERRVDLANGISDEHAIRLQTKYRKAYSANPAN